MNELLVVEDPPESIENDYTGFLNNLGTAISASFVSKNGKKSPANKANLNIKTELDIFLLGNAQPESDHVLDSNDETSLNEGDCDVSKTIFRCPFCRKSFESKDYFSRHMAICEKFSKNTCYICDEQLYSLAKLLVHMQSAHSLAKNIQPSKSKDIDEAIKTYVCETCGTIKKSRTSLMYHIIQFHKDGKRFTCEDCGKMFYFAYKLELHRQGHKKSDIVEVCSICAKTFHYKGGLASHMRIHTQDYKYQCRYCGKKFIYQYGIKSHERTHTGERPYSCSTCEKTFCRYGEMRNHIRRIHTGERPYSCTLCEKGFFTTDNLKVHMFQHKGSFECQLCLKGFVSKEVLSYHVKRIHKITEQGTDNEHLMLEEKDPLHFEELTEESSQESDEGEKSS